MAGPRGGVVVNTRSEAGRFGLRLGPRLVDLAQTLALELISRGTSRLARTRTSSRRLSAAPTEHAPPSTPKLGEVREELEVTGKMLIVGASLGQICPGKCPGKCRCWSGSAETHPNRPVSPQDLPTPKVGGQFEPKSPKHLSTWVCAQLCWNFVVSRISPGSRRLTSRTCFEQFPDDLIAAAKLALAQGKACQKVWARDAVAERTQCGACLPENSQGSPS